MFYKRQSMRSQASKLKHKPQVTNEVVGDRIAKLFESLNLVPTFFFVDPWGYKGLSLEV
ncbi:MAG: hypothetical protein NVS1B11_28660 [Terriglobales bacterium]